MVRWCFGFLNGEVKESLDHDVRTSGPKVNSLQVSDVSTETPTGSQHPSLSQSPSNLRIFTFSELKNATRNFSRSLIVGEGGFGCVFRGSIRSPEEPHGRIEIAVKQYNRKGMQGHKEWLTEVNVLGVVEHPNLVKLIGYCIEDDERGIQLLLVYEFILQQGHEEWCPCINDILTSLFPNKLSIRRCPTACELWWGSASPGGTAGRLARLTIAATWWAVWLERNRRIFELKKRPLHDVLADARQLRDLWGCRM